MHVRTTPDNSSLATPIHIANLHLHIQGGVYICMGPSVQIHDGDAVAKERDTPSPFFVTCVDHKVNPQL